MTDPLTGERILTGLAVAPGIATGPAFLRITGRIAVPERTLAPAQIGAELQRFTAAVSTASRQIDALKRKARQMPEDAAEEMQILLDSRLAMLASSRLVRGVERRIEGASLNAEAAVRDEIDAIAAGFAAMADSYLAARAEDVRELGDRLLRILLDVPYDSFAPTLANALLVADELTPADTALIDPERFAGIATEAGGAEGHTAIMARSLGLPCVLGVAGLTEAVENGATLVIDGGAGLVVVNPSPETLARCRAGQDAAVAEAARLATIVTLPAVTRDGVDIRLSANVELPRDVTTAMAGGAQGIGLLRTEFLFMNRDDLPDEDEQFRQLAGMVQGMQGRPVTIRTLDIGGEKLTPALRGRLRVGGDNPALGLRGIRLSLAEPALLHTQLAAILRVALLGPVRVMLPMVSHVGELHRVREILPRVALALRQRGIAVPDPLPQLGSMIEVPGAALAADAIATASDFLAIGTNDLTMYTLAIDRADEQVASLYDPLHPAVLRLIQFTVEAGARAGIPVSVCGEIAGNPRYVPLLTGLGVRDLSMAPPKIGRVKQHIRAMSLDAAARRAAEIMVQWDQRRIAELLDGFEAGAS